MDVSKLPLFVRGKSMLNDALSPSTRRRFSGFLGDVEEATGADSHSTSAAQRPSPVRSHAISDAPSLWTLPSSSSSSSSASPRSQESGEDAWIPTAPLSTGRSLVQIQCHVRPFCVKLTMERGQLVVCGFDTQSDGLPGCVERSGLVHNGDVLVRVNGEATDALTSLEEVVAMLSRAELPATLTFDRMAPVKATLGEYTADEIGRHLLRCNSSLTAARGVQEAAMLVQACIEVFEKSRSTIPLANYIKHVEKVVFPPVRNKSHASRSTASDQHERLELIKQTMEAVHRRVDARRKEQLKDWNAGKASNYRRIEILERQLVSIKGRLEKMRENREELRPENHATWSQYIELRHLANQLSESVERSKQEHYLPDFEGYLLRFGSDGVYVGMGDIWVPNFHAKFTIETRSTAPHLFFHISTPSSSGLKLRIKNFKLATEGRLPSFRCDELNVEAQLIADIPLAFDAIAGWRVPQEELDVKLLSFLYYERQTNSSKRGKDHDTVLKMFINRLLPSVVRHAVQQLLCVELGPLLERRDAQVVVAGEIKISGRKLALYDVALNNLETSTASPLASAEQDQSEQAREMMAISSDEAEVLHTLFKTFLDAHNSKKSMFGRVETPHMSIRNLISYFDQFHDAPQLKIFAYELWGQGLQLLSASSSWESPSNGDLASSSPFASIVASLEQIQEYPVDVSVSLLDVTFRLDLCEGAATYYMALQRILRRRMDSSSVGLANLDALRDGTYLENKLARLDEQYEKVNRLLSYLTTNVDVLGVIFRGSLPSGITSKLFVEARDLTCKGPCAGSVTIPLTDLAALSTPNGLAVELDDRATDAPRSILTRTHEHGALVLSKLFLDSLQGSADEQNALGTEMVELPSDRLKVSVENPSVCVLFEVPSDLSLLTPGATLAPFSFSMVTDDPTEPPKLQVETGEFGKCQYKAKRVALSGSVWQFVQRTKEEAGRVLETPEAKEPAEKDDSGPEAAADGSVWEDYLASPFFSLRFHFFTSCQVTRDHIFLSVGSASLEESKVAQLKHRLSIGQLLQDVGMLSVVGSGSDAAKRKARVHFQHALRREAMGSSASQRGPASVSNLSRRQTLFSPTSVADSTDDLDRASEPLSLYESESNGEESALPATTAAATPRTADSDGDQLPPPLRVGVATAQSRRASQSSLFF